MKMVLASQKAPRCGEYQEPVACTAVNSYNINQPDGKEDLDLGACEAYL